jgi:hypothetical protein
MLPHCVTVSYGLLVTKAWTLKTWLSLDRIHSQSIGVGAGARTGAPSCGAIVAWQKMMRLWFWVRPPILLPIYSEKIKNLYKCLIFSHYCIYANGRVRDRDKTGAASINGMNRQNKFPYKICKYLTTIFLNIFLFSYIFHRAYNIENMV